MVTAGVQPPQLLLVLLLLAAAADSRRSVNWFNSGGGWTIGTDGLNFSSWLAAHGPSSPSPAITGTMPCCGCWGVNATTGIFNSSPRCARANAAAGPSADWAAAQAAGLTIEPTGSLPPPFLLNESWLLPGSLDSAVAMVESAGWTGFGIDNEDWIGKGSPTSPRLPEQFRRFLGNLSKVMGAAKKTVVIDVCSTWHGDIGGPEHLADYAKAAPGIRFLDMGEYFSDDTNSFYTKLPALKQMLPLPAIAPAVGLTAAAGHKNASCGGWPQCANVTDKACGCIDYKWNHTAFSAFVREVERLGISEIDVWRQDMTPPPGTTASIPDWLLSELAGFLKRGEELELEEGDEDRVLSVLNPGYGGRASPSKGRRARERARAPDSTEAAP